MKPDTSTSAPPNLEARTARQELFDTLRERSAKLSEIAFRRCLIGSKKLNPQRYYYVREWVNSGNIDDMLKLNLSEFLNLLDVTRTLEDLYSHKRKGILSKVPRLNPNIEDREISERLKTHAETVGPNRLAEAIGISRSTFYNALSGKMSDKTRDRIVFFLDFGSMSKLAAEARDERQQKLKKQTPWREIEHLAEREEHHDQTHPHQPAQKPLDDLKDFI